MRRRCLLGRDRSMRNRLLPSLKSGAWQRRHEELLPMKELDLGYRILIAPGNRRHGLTSQ
jgi:hypothetical protein